MFAVVRTGGKQYRVAPGDKIVVEKLDGNAGDKITLGEVLLAGEGSDLKSADGLTVAAEIVAQSKADKVTVFKKRRRHNYRRKKGHRQMHTILKIVAIGDQKEQKKPAPKAAAEDKPAKSAPAKSDETKVQDDAAQKGDVAGQPTPNPAPADPDAAKGTKASAKSAAPKAESKSTENAAPAKGSAKKAPKAK